MKNIILFIILIVIFILGIIIELFKTYLSEELNITWTRCSSFQKKLIVVSTLISILILCIFLPNEIFKIIMRSPLGVAQQAQQITETINLGNSSKTIAESTKSNKQTINYNVSGEIYNRFSDDYNIAVFIKNKEGYSYIGKIPEDNMQNDNWQFNLPPYVEDENVKLLFYLVNKDTLKNLKLVLNKPSKQLPFDMQYITSKIISKDIGNSIGLPHGDVSDCLDLRNNGNELLIDANNPKNSKDKQYYTNRAITSYQDAVECYKEEGVKPPAELLNSLSKYSNK
ncbi:MAG: hypothetical protein HQK91_10295 [Nitrospirae bacterium]|nr:hypothetical protein [Nitrospirota bacterium]